MTTKTFQQKVNVYIILIARKVIGAIGSIWTLMEPTDVLARETATRLDIMSRDMMIGPAIQETGTGIVIPNMITGTAIQVEMTDTASREMMIGIVTLDQKGDIASQDLIINIKTEVGIQPVDGNEMNDHLYQKRSDHVKGATIIQTV